MTFDLAAIIASKRALRERLAALSIGDKLRMLDTLRERALALRPRVTPDAAAARQTERRG